jgi:predicted nucleotidyltransferase
MQREHVLRVLEANISEMKLRFEVQSLRIFGSVARDDATAKSDVDVLVDFGGPPTFDRYMDLKFYLEDLLETRVDLVTESGLRDRVRPHVEKEAVSVA